MEGRPLARALPCPLCLSALTLAPDHLRNVATLMTTRHTFGAPILGGLGLFACGHVGCGHRTARWRDECHVWTWGAGGVGVCTGKQWRLRVKDVGRGKLGRGDQQVPRPGHALSCAPLIPNAGVPRTQCIVFPLRSLFPLWLHASAEGRWTHHVPHSNATVECGGTRGACLFGPSPVSPPCSSVAAPLHNPMTPATPRPHRRPSASLPPFSFCNTRSLLCGSLPSAARWTCPTAL